MAESSQILSQPREADPVPLPPAASMPRQPTAEARRHPRYAFRGRARALVYPPPSQPASPPLESEVLTTDLSRSGVSLLHRRALVPGQRLRLLLHQADRLVEVCWCCRVWPGLYAAGCRFIPDEANGA